MSRIISIEKVNISTLVTVTVNGSSHTSSSSIRRDLKEHFNGLIIEPNNDEPMLNNFEISLNELDDTYGAKTPKELMIEFAKRGFFSGVVNQTNGEVNMNQNNKVKVIELPGVVVPPKTSFEDALAIQLNQYSDLEVKEDEILIAKVGRFLPGESGEGK
ncbi:hypothetical protein [Tenacibaculum aiptasiae]|uniref:hypothetical protein n=1 Tax=Tenacibaculum aiptasiae TaxID=426481 RepID=UPI00232ACD07|nr:hypothetical protein [Tenacibaculum aiptasiae]